MIVKSGMVAAIATLCFWAHVGAASAAGDRDAARTCRKATAALKTTTGIRAPAAPARVTRMAQFFVTPYNYGWPGYGGAYSSGWVGPGYMQQQVYLQNKIVDLYAGQVRRQEFEQKTLDARLRNYLIYQKQVEKIK